MKLQGTLGRECIGTLEGVKVTWNGLGGVTDTLQRILANMEEERLDWKNVGNDVR